MSFELGGFPPPFFSSSYAWEETLEEKKKKYYGFMGTIGEEQAELGGWY